MVYPEALNAPEPYAPSHELLSTRDSDSPWMICWHVKHYFYWIFTGSKGDYGRRWKPLEMGEWWDGWDSNPGPKP
jgi:hypothetical protein